MNIRTIRLKELCRVLLLLTCISCLSIVPTVAELDCRRYVYHPKCRGAQAKRDTTRIPDDYRFTVDNDRDYYMDPERQSLLENTINMKGILGQLLRKALARNNDFDTDSGNYLK